MSPPAECCKIFTARPLDAKSRAITDHIIEVMRSRHDRYLTYYYRQAFGRIRERFMALDHVPTMEEAERIVMSEDDFQLRVLSDSYRALYPEAVSLVEPSKSMPRSQRKAVDDVVSQRLEEWIRTNLGKHIGEIDRTTLDRIRELLRLSPSVADFQEALATQVFHDSLSRATTIARTETTSASNTAMQVAAEEYSFGRPVSKTWETRGTGTVRESHRAMQDVTIGIDELFQVPTPKGGIDLLAYPGDTSHGASAANIVNCRCWCSYIYDD